MPLHPGALVGPYQVLAPLGAGGMGEVYRAKDTRLGREVALKVLPEALAADPDRLRRFGAEARAASSLNHPNIVTVLDAGQSGGVSYLAMELVSGQTLRQLLASGALPARRLLAIGSQIADGLARAHEAGIVHRDLKPENVMVASGGLVKLLDFGLARLESRDDAGSDATGSTLSGMTAPGAVMGTAGYMSPEQAVGRPVDFRSDQFSLGSMLYEMASGRRAFTRDSAPETMCAIIREEPEPIGVVAPSLPVSLRWIVERCLAKDPRERYDSTRDLARDLARLRDGLAEASSSGTVAAARPVGRVRLWPAWVVAGVVAGVAVGLAAAHWRRPAPADWRLVTFRSGSVAKARFSPDGQTIYYAAAWEGKPLQVFSTRLDSTEATALALPSATVASVSSTGQLAVVFQRDPPVLAEVSLAGGAPRELFEAVPFADWRPGGDSLAIVRGSRLEFPPGKVLYDAPGRELIYPRFAPRGDSIAVIETLSMPSTDQSSIVLVDLAGRARTLSGGWGEAYSLAWNGRTDEVWFSAREKGGRYGGLALHAVSRSGRHRVIARGPGQLLVDDVSNDGRILLRQVDWRLSLMCRPAGAAREIDLSWFDRSTVKDLSPDGRMVLFDESGFAGGAKAASFLRETDGASPAIRLGDGLALALSPDKKWAITVPPDLPDRFVLLPTGAGQPRVFPQPGRFCRTARFLLDGSRAVVDMSELGHRGRIYVLDLTDGAARPVTPEGFGMGPVSPDGKMVAARSLSSGSPEYVLYPLQGGQPRAVEGIGPGEVILQWAADDRAFYVASGPAVVTGLSPLRIERFELATGRRQLVKELTPADPTGVEDYPSGFITPDGQSYAYTVQRMLSRLFVVTGLE